MEFLLGQRLINSKNEEILLEELLKSKIIALFFTATWCSPCSIFEKLLLELYSDANMGDKVFEVVQISFDHTEAEYKKSLLDKPWLFFAYNDPKIKELTDQFGIETVPMFLVFNSGGKLITDKGRKEIYDEGFKVIDDWIAKSN